MLWDASELTVGKAANITFLHVLGTPSIPLISSCNFCDNHHLPWSPPSHWPFPPYNSITSPPITSFLYPPNVPSLPPTDHYLPASHYPTSSYVLWPRPTLHLFPSLALTSYHLLPRLPATPQTPPTPLLIHMPFSTSDHLTPPHFLLTPLTPPSLFHGWRWSAISSWYSCPSIVYQASHHPTASSYPYFLIQLSLIYSYLPPTSHFQSSYSTFIFTPPTSCHCHFSISSSIC